MEKTCSEPGCPNPVNKGLSICSTHYRRKLRGSKIEGPPRGYGNDLQEVAGPLVVDKVYVMMKATVRLTKSSFYEVQRNIIVEWLERFSAGQPPFLTKGLLDRPRLVSKDETAGKPVSGIHLTHEQYGAWLRSQKQFPGFRPGALLALILNDWWYFWAEHQDAKIDTKVCPFPATKARRGKRAAGK